MLSIPCYSHRPLRRISFQPQQRSALLTALPLQTSWHKCSSAARRDEITHEAQVLDLATTVWHEPCATAHRIGQVAQTRLGSRADKRLVGQLAEAHLLAVCQPVAWRNGEHESICHHWLPGSRWRALAFSRAEAQIRLPLLKASEGLEPAVWRVLVKVDLK